MTAHDTNLSILAAGAGAMPTGAVTRANRDVAHDTIPVVVWRTSLEEPDATPDSDTGDSPLTARLAHYLVAIYSDAHAAVIDLDADDNLRHAAETTGRRYVAVTSPSDLAALPEQPRPAALIVLRWPRPGPDAPEQDPNFLLSTCQHHLAHDGSTIIAVTAATPGRAGTTYTEHEQVLLSAAETAGLHHLHDIVPLPATDGCDSFTYATAPADTASGHVAGSDALRQTTDTTLMIFGRARRRP